MPRNDGHTSGVGAGVGVCAVTALTPTIADNTRTRHRMRMFANVIARPSATLVVFFSLTYVLSWTCFAGAAALSNGVGGGVFGLAGLAGPVLLIGVFMPAAVGAGLTLLRDGPDGVRILFRQVVEPPVRAHWYVFAIVYFAIVKLSVALLHRAITGAWPVFGSDPWYLM